jgi:hypothetical protein
MLKGWHVKCAIAAAATLALLPGTLALGQGTAQAQAPTYQVCSTSGGQHCMSRDGGRTSNGTSIIAYHKNEANNDFTFLALPSECGHGKVTLSCPNLGNAQLNGALDGALIGEIGRAGKNQCLAAGGKLQACNASGTVQIFSYCGDTIPECTESLAINVYWTNHDKALRYVNIPSNIGGLVNEGSTTGDVMRVIHS